MITKQNVRSKLDENWAAKTIKTDWLKLEQFLADILISNHLDDNEKCAATREAIDSVTRRGHFNLDSYFPPLEEVS